jgi:hypothetical protein
MNEPKFKIIKKGKVPAPDTGDPIRRHEQSLLQLLIERHYDRAKEIIQRLAESERAKAA